MDQVKPVEDSLKNLKLFGLPKWTISLEFFKGCFLKTFFNWSILEYLDPYDDINCSSFLRKITPKNKNLESTTSF